MDETEMNKWMIKAIGFQEELIKDHSQTLDVEIGFLESTLKVLKKLKVKRGDEEYIRDMISCITGYINASKTKKHHLDEVLKKTNIEKMEIEG